MKTLDDLINRHVEQTHSALAGIRPRPIDQVTKPRSRRTATLAIGVSLGVLAVVILNLTLLPRPEVPLSDPSTGGSFSPTGSLHQDCFWCPATLLQDGRVLVVGSVAEIYDPISGEFTVAGSPRYGYADGSAVLLPDGRVLLFRGIGSGSEIYDPETRSFVELQPGGQVAAASSLEDGRVLVIYLDGRAQIFDPATERFLDVSATADVVGDGMGDRLTTTLLDDGRVLIKSSSLQLFDPTTESFGRIWSSSLANPDAAVKLQDGQVAIISQDSIELFDPATGSLTQVGLKEARWWSTAARLQDGRVLILGGAGDTAEIFDPRTGESNLLASRMTRDRRAATAVPLNDGRILIIGHYPGNIPNPSDRSGSTAEIFTP